MTKRKNRRKPSPNTPRSSQPEPARNTPPEQPLPNDAPAAREPRGRPGRRSAEERTNAVLDLIAGKATAEQISRRLGVQVETVLRWREAATEGIAQSLKQPDGKSKRERELERELSQLQHAFTRLAIKHEILDRELSKRPTQPGKSSR